MLGGVWKGGRGVPRVDMLMGWDVLRYASKSGVFFVFVIFLQ